MKTIIRIVVALIIIMAIPVLAFVYLTTGKPRDLGIKYTDQDVITATTKNGVPSAAIVVTPGQEPLRYEGKQEIKTSFTSSEITAINNSNKYVYKPFSNVQLKINSDGTGEASGTLDVNKLLSLISFSYSTDEIKKAISDYHIGLNPPFYLKGQVSVINNHVTLSPQTIEVGRIKIPQSIVSQNIGYIVSFADSRLNSIPNLQIRSLDLNGGTVNLDATYPQKEYSLQN